MYAKLVFRNAKRSVKDYLIYIVTMTICVTLFYSLYYRVVVIRAPLQGLCYTVRDAVDWFQPPTTRWFQKGSNHSPLQFC